MISLRGLLQPSSGGGPTGQHQLPAYLLPLQRSPGPSRLGPGLSLQPHVQELTGHPGQRAVTPFWEAECAEDSEKPSRSRASLLPAPGQAAECKGLPCLQSRGHGANSQIPGCGQALGSGCCREWPCSTERSCSRGPQRHDPSERVSGALPDRHCCLGEEVGRPLGKRHFIVEPSQKSFILCGAWSINLLKKNPTRK